MLLLILCFLLEKSNNVVGQHLSIYKKYNLHYSNPIPSTNDNDISIFIHAAVGIFPIKRKRPGQLRDTWVSSSGYGLILLS